VLPSQKESHVVLRRDGVDLAPQPVQCVAVDARQQAAVAVLISLAARREPPSQHEAAGLQHAQPPVDVLGVEA
jgi:hypothetical protein